MNWRPNAAMVLAAGLGQRMRPLTNGLPKPLVRLHGKALIDHVLDRIAAADVLRAVVNVHYCADQIRAHLAARIVPSITVSDESACLLDTGGGTRKALSHLSEDGFLVHNSDSVWIDGVGSNLERMFVAWDAAGMDCLMLLAGLESSLGYAGRGDFSLDLAGRVVRRAGEACVPFVFTGVSIAHPRLFSASPDGPFSLNLLWDRAIVEGRVFGLVLEGTWMHIGDPAALEKAEKLLDAGPGA